MKKLLAIVLTAAMLLAMLCACAAKPTETAATDTKATIGILMPTKEQTIWSIQGERLTEAFQKAGYATQIEYAEDDSAKQAMQIENMITKGVNVLVIAAVDCAALTDACEKAKDAGIYVIADDRLITNTKAVDFYVTFDLVRMGELQGQYIVDKLDLENQAGPFTLEIFSGSQDDTNAISFYQGAMNKLQPYLDNGKLVVKSGQSSPTRRPPSSPGTPPRRSPVWITSCPATMPIPTWMPSWSRPTASRWASSPRSSPWATAPTPTPIPS